MGDVGANPDGLWENQHTCLWASFLPPGPPGQAAHTLRAEDTDSTSSSFKEGSNLVPPKF